MLAWSLLGDSHFPFFFATLLFFILAGVSHDEETPPDELFRRCARVPADEAAWREFFARYAECVKIRLGKVLGFSGWQRERLFEEAQQLFNLRLLTNDRRALLAFRGRTEPEARAYLQRIAASVAITIATGEKKKRLPSSDDPSTETRIKTEKPPDDDPRADLEKCLREKLRGRNKARNILMFKLFALEELKPAEIAQIHGMGMTARAVELQISRIREKLRKCFGPK